MEEMKGSLNETVRRSFPEPDSSRWAVDAHWSDLPLTPNPSPPEGRGEWRIATPLFVIARWMPEPFRALVLL
jgi:hypothetical protein